VHLADVLTATAIAGVLLSAALTVFAQGQRAYVHGVARVESQQNARVALARMAREIRQAGSPRLAPIAVAEPARIVVQHDLDGDGAAAARGETVTWLLSAGVLRRNAGGGAQPIINGVRALAFTYLDSAGNPTAAPAAVRVVVISLTTEPERPGAGGATQTKLVTEVRLRNRASD
jgi:type II secretory pathway component PulJ